MSEILKRIEDIASFRVKTPGHENVVGITLDDGPNMDNLEAVLGTLKDNGATATFFWIVDYAKQFKVREPIVFGRLLHQLRDDGHEIGLHAPRDYKPTIKTKLISAFSREELSEALGDLKGITDMPIEQYFPHMLLQPKSILDARSLGLWMPLRDAVHYADAAAPVNDQVEKFSGARSGNIVVFHDGISMYRQVTYITDVLPQVLHNLGESGNGLVKVTQMPRVIRI